MLNIKKTLILLVISLFFLVLITPKVYSVVAEECNPATGPGYQIGFAEDAICFYCYENDGLCLDIEFKDSWCISNNAYDPDCYYPIQATQSEKYSYWYDSINQKLWWIPYDFCGDGIDNDGDGAIDFADGECDENLQTPTYSPPGTVLEGTQITVSCPFLPLVNGVSFTDYTFSQQPTKRPTVNAYMITTSCGNPIGWSGNTAQFTCNAAGGQLACHSNQLGDSESTISSVSVSYLSCAAKGGALTRPAGYMCDTVPASDGTCYVNCVKDLRDPDGDGLTTFEEETAGADGFITNPNNPDTDGDGISDGPLAPVGSGLIPGPDPAPNVADEVCTSAGDEDGNGESDYDSIDGKHGDITCPVSITSITSSKTTVDNGETFTVSCGSSIANINSISATLGGRTCTFTNWVGSTANFACTATSTCPTTETARCFVDTLKSYATAPTEKTATITVKCSSCSAYILTTSCTTDTRCEWCLECGGTNKYRGADGNICVATGTCSYSCRKDKCNAVCDNTNGGWINYLCDNYCSGNNLYIRSDVNNFCYDGISPDNCLASTYTCTTGVAQSCGITPCDAAKNLVGSCNNPCVNIGTATDGTDAYCGACTPTCSCAAGYYDINQNMADGCEYACTISNGGIEICDNKDNNCNGQIDEQLTQQCGATDAGECSYGIETCSAGAWTGCTAITPQTEICTDLKDNDCDSLSDYDTKQDLDMQFRHGDDNCPVSITAISLSTATIRAGADTFNIECTVSPSTPGLNSIFAYIDKDGNGVYNSGDLDLGWQAGDVYASGKYYFNSRTISTSGTYKINCGVYSSGTEPFDRSYQSGADQTATITVIPSICSDRTQTSCSFGGDCKWVPQCDSSSPKYTGDIGRCVETATVITESCSVPICSEQCDGSNLLNVCTATSQCVSKVYQLRTPSCSSTCLCSYSTWVTQACNTAYCTADCNAGFKQDTGVDYCNTNLGDIYNRWEGCSSLCTITDAAEADVIKEDCVNTCTDTDGGQVYTTQGTVTDKNLCSSSSQITCPATIIKTDSCSGTTLTEYFCNGNDNSYTNYNCNNLDSVTPNSGTDTCIWSDYGCSTGACSLTSSGNVNCDSYDDIDGSDGVIKDYETDATKCILGCTTTSCCLAPLTYTSDGLCGTKTIEGINYIAYNDGANKWGTLSTVNAVKEICNDGKDNNCNGFIDSKDPACVIVTSINSLDTVTQIDQSFEVKCGTTIDSNCMGLTISAGSCVFDETKGTAGWDLTNPNEPKAIFSCTASAAGSINLNCYISNNQDGSCTVGGITATPTPSNIGKTITAIASACGSRVIGDCPFDGKCEWCPTCGSLDNTFQTNPKFSSGTSIPGTCIEKNSCSDRYQCRKTSCDATCDAGDWSNCLGYQTCPIDTCVCQTKPCSFSNLGEQSYHSGDPGKVYICAGTSTSQAWILSTLVLPENQYSCIDGKDNNGNGLTDCADSACEGLTKDGNLCCTEETTCTNLGCSDFDACSNDKTKRGFTKSCVLNICQKTANACTVECPITSGAQGCCVPGNVCANDKTFSDIDLDGKKEICNSGDWLGANCALPPNPINCVSTDSIDYNCIVPNDCSLNTGNCGEKTCINYQCGVQRVADPIAKCQTTATTLGYECAVTSTNPQKACKEDPVGQFNCLFGGFSELCGNNKNLVLGYDAGCSGDQTGETNDYKCSIDICQSELVVSDPCCLCYSQCSVAASNPTKAPYSLDECEMAKNAQWINPDCTLGG